MAKRQVKSPKVPVRDGGLLHAPLGIEGRRALLGNPRVGSSWEGWVIESIRNALADLEVERIVVIYPGSKPCRLSEQVEVVPASVLADRGALARTLWVRVA